MMKTEILQAPPALLPYVSSIMVMENDVKEIETRLPFYADGCPGIMFAETENDLVLEPHHLVLDEFILYGQTITPIELCLKGRFRLIVFILYPFVPKSLFGIEPSQITDSCTSLCTRAHEVLQELKKNAKGQEQVKTISTYLLKEMENREPKVHPIINQAIDRIIASKGNSPIKNIRESLHMTERTFERNFASEIGISAKLFAQIIQFQVSLSQLTSQQKMQLSDIVYENGFADQSHFIRSFRKFSGKTPASFKKNPGV